MNNGESFQNRVASKNDGFEDLAKEPFAGGQPEEDLSGEEMVEQIITEKNRPADPKKIFPDVFSDKYPEDISPKCRSAIESFDETDIFDVVDAFETNFKFGSDKLVGYLTQILDLNYRPKLIYREKVDDTFGEYLPGKEDENGKDKDGGIIVLYYNPGKEKNYSYYKEYIDTIGHEMWHARQHQHRHDGDIRGNMYAANHDHYINPEEDENGYFSQLFEKESSWFGHQLKHKVDKIVREGEKAATIVKRLRKIFDGRHDAEN